MKIIANTKEMNQALSVIAKTLSPRPVREVFSGILVETENAMVRLTASDGSIARSSMRIAADVLEPGKAVLMADKLCQIVSRLDTPSIQIEAKEKSAVVRYGENAARIAVIPGEYPELAAEPETVPVRYNRTDLANALRAVGYCVSTAENGNQTLTGVLCEVSPVQTTFVGLDGFQLATRVISEPNELPGTLENVRAIIPGKAVGEIVRLLDMSEAPTVTLVCGKQRVALSTETVSYQATLIGGNYPDYRRIVPKTFDTEVKVNREKFAQALARVTVFADNRLMKIALKKDEIVMTATAETGGIVERLTAESNGPEVKFGVNPRYITDVVKHIGAEDLTIHMNGPVTPIVVTAMGCAEGVNLVLPVRIMEDENENATGNVA